MSSSRKKPRAAKAQKQKSATVRREEAAAAQPVEKQKATGETTVENMPVAKGTASRLSFLKMPSAPVLVLLGVLAVALVIRLLPALYAIRDGHLLFGEYDAYYHMRRISYVVANFPGYNIFDSYVNYPQGFFIGWPPLYDLTAGAVALVAGLGHPGQLVTELAAAATNVAIGLLGIVAVFYLARDIFGEKVALCSAFVMAVLPATVSVTFLNYIDHHSLEMLVSVAMYLFFLRSVTKGKAQGMAFSGFASKKEPIVYAALTGVAIAAAVLAWDGAPFFIGVMAASAFLLYVLDAYRGESSEYLTITGIIAMLVATVLIAPMAATSYYGQRMEISAIYLSWFHIIMLVAVAAFFVFMGLLTMGAKKSRAPWFAVPAITLVAVGATLLAVREFLPQVYANLEAGLSFMSGSTVVLSSISQVSPLFMVSGEFSLMTVLTFYGTILFIAIPAIVYMLFRGKTRTEAGKIFFLLWTAVVVVMNLLQSRFTYLAGINVAIVTGYGICLLADTAGLEKVMERYARTDKGIKLSWRKRLRLPAGLIVVILAVAVLLIQPVLYSVLLGTTPISGSASWDDAGRWIKDNTPVTSYTYSAGLGTMPEYGVMTWWDFGNYILYEAQRPAVANNFQTGIEDSADFFIAQDEPAADRIMEKDNAKYVAVSLRMGSPTTGISGGIFGNMPTLAGDNLSTYYTDFRRLDPAAGGTMAYADGTNKYYGSMYSRLYNELGMGGRDRLGNLTSGLQHYRLLYLSKGSDPVFVFEKLKGATITGKAEPGNKVNLGLNVTFNGANLTYVSRTVADGTGAYSFTVPYATGVTSGAVQTAPHYVISSGNARTEVDVSEDAVQNGKTSEAGGL
ncbi:MAG: oligosaccharyl transferase, archaeosortase A system-associated [Methanocella sp.]